MCDNYRLKYLEAVNTFRIANEEYESQLLAISPGVSAPVVKNRQSPGRRHNPMAITHIVESLRLNNANK